MNYDSKTWKLQNQVLWIFLKQSSMLIIILLVIDACSYVLITQTFRANSKAMMVKQNNQSTTFTQYLIVTKIGDVINQSSRTIVNANYLFQYSIGLNYQYIQQPLDCLTNQKNTDQYSYISSVCYGFYGVKKKHTIQDHQLFNFTALMTTILPLYQSFTFYYAQTKDNYYFAQNPGQNLTNMNFHLRPWYTTYLKKNDSSLTTFSTPYLSSIGGYLIAQSTGLKYKNGTNFGIFGHPLRILNILQSIQQNMNISIVDKTGLIYSVGNQNSNQIYLSNESYTGFNLAQQRQILATLDKQSIVLWNSLFGQNVSINARSLADTGLILIFLSNPLFEEELINQHLNETSDLLFVLYQKTLIVWTFVTLFCILVSAIILMVILRPIANVTSIMKKKISPLHTKKLLYLSLYDHNQSQLSNFETAFHTMTTSISQSNLQINSQCTFMNNLQCYALSQNIWLRVMPHLMWSCNQIEPDFRQN